MILNNEKLSVEFHDPDVMELTSHELEFLGTALRACPTGEKHHKLLGDVTNSFERLLLKAETHAKDEER